MSRLTGKVSWTCVGVVMCDITFFSALDSLSLFLKVYTFVQELIQSPYLRLSINLWLVCWLPAVTQRTKRASTSVINRLR